MIAVVTADEQPRRIAESRGLASRAAPVFAGRRMYLAGSDQVVCIERPEALGDKFSDYELAALKTGFFTREIGAAPGEASELKLTPPAGFIAAEGVPVVKMESGVTPNQWMFAGPFFVDEQVDVFAQQGGAGVVRPVPGQTVAYTQTKQPDPKKEAEYTQIEGRPATAAWRVLDPKASAYDAKTARAKFDATRHIIMAEYAQALGNPRLTGGINFATASGRAYFTTCYAYTVLDVPKAGVYRAELMGGRIKGQDIYLAGQRLENETVVHLETGRYPLMARVALAACGNWEPIDWAIQFRELREVGAPPQPQANAIGPVTPFVTGAGLPVRLLGQWPLPAGLVSTAPDLKSFKPVPVEAFVAGKAGTDRDSFNVPQPTGSYGLNPKLLLGNAPNARGLFYAVWENRRPVIVELDCPKGARFWLSGREIFDGETIRLAPGLYPLLFEVRADVPAPAMPAFRAVSDQAADLAAWQRRVRKNEPLLRLIAGSGPQGAYAKKALAAVEGR
jgi:hypothetical protein